MIGEKNETEVKKANSSEYIEIHCPKVYVLKDVLASQMQFVQGKLR